MKAYRIIGTVLSALLAFFFAIEIFGLVALHGTARAVNKNTITAITDAFLDNEELYGEMTENISKEVSVNISAAITENFIGDDINISSEAVEKAVSEVLNSDAFKDVISDVASDLVMDMMDPDSEGTTLDVGKKLTTMFEENPETFDAIIEDVASDSGASYDDIYNTASAYMSQAGITVPEYGASYSEMMAAVVGFNDEMLNSLLNDYLAAAGLSAGDIPDDPDTDYAPMDSEAEADAAVAGMQSLMKDIGLALDFQKSPVYIVIICASFLLFFGICALLTWSIRRPLLISGIMTAFYGILLLAFSSLSFPTELLMPFFEESFGTAAITAHDILAIAWGAASQNIMLCGILSIVMAVLLIGGFILWKILEAKRPKALA